VRHPLQRQQRHRQLHMVRYTCKNLKGGQCDDFGTIFFENNGDKIVSKYGKYLPKKLRHR
jgi:hypothetical protein